MINIAVMGYGTVGTGVVNVLKDNEALITERVGQDVNVKYVLDLRDFPGTPIQDKIIHDFDVLLQDDEVKIVVEVMGGLEPAYTFVKKCLQAGKHVVTSNKALVAQHGADLFRVAKEKNVKFLFEASVGGGIPIIRPLVTSLSADEVEEITGILNGTTNYMMTKMFYEGANYADVLKEAQANGYAEADPTADVEGHDACRKIAILSSVITGKRVDFEEIYTEGISKISAEDMQYAKAKNMTIKLLATAKKNEFGIKAIVAPFMLQATHPLYSVNDVFNAVFIRGNMLGEAMFYGQGAGELPTASAVVSDIVEAAFDSDKSMLASWTQDKQELRDNGKVRRTFFVRIQGDRQALENELREKFGVSEFVSVEGLKEEFAFFTDKMTEEDYAQKAQAYPNILGCIRVEM